MKRLTIAFVLLCLAVPTLHAQDGWDWGENEAEAKGNYILTKSAVESRRYAEGRASIQWLLANTPNLNKNLYYYGAQLFEGLVYQETVPAKKMALQDSALLMYDIWMQKYGDEAYVLNQKTRLAYSYLAGRPGTFDQLDQLYTRNYELNGAETNPYSLGILMTIAATKTKAKRMSESEVFDLFDKLSVALEAQKAKTKDAATLTYIGQVEEQIVSQLTSCAKVDCEFVRQKYAEKLNASKDVNLAKRVFTLMKADACIKDPLFIDALAIIIEDQPNADLYVYQAKVYDNAGKTEEAIGAYRKAAELATADSAKAEYLLDAAQLLSTKGKYGEARSLAREALGKRPGYGAAYILIGNLYMRSGSSCGSSDALETSLPYLAAYEQFQKAGATSKMAEAQKYFPSMETIFARGKAVGDVMNTGCWIGESVTIRKR